MSIEDTLTRIAVALEAIAGKSVAHATADAAWSEARAGHNSAPAEEPIKRGPGRPPKPKAEAPIPAPAPVLDESETFDPVAPPNKAPTIDDVRSALIALQKRTSPETARAVLKGTGGCDTLKALSPDKYAAVIAAAKPE